MCQQNLTYCNSMSKFYPFPRIWLTFWMFCIFFACSLEQESQHQVPFDSIRATCVISENGQYIITGTATDTTSAQPNIKSPFIMVFDSTLVKLSQYYYQTPTTSLNPKITLVSPTEYILSYYHAKSLGDQTEISQLLYLNTAFNTNKKVSYGNRTRIKDLLSHKNETLITLNYERSSQHTSIQFLQDKKLGDKISYAVSDETNIPTSMLVLENEDIIIAGIANGFHYPDGHEYKNPKAVGYIIHLDESGLEKSRYMHHGEGHVFIHDLVQHEATLHAIGTHQSEATGMDQLILSLDSDLNILTDSIFRENGVQKWLLAKRGLNHLYITGITEDLIDHTMKLQLQCVSKNHEVLWKKTIPNNGSYMPTDLIITKTHLILLVEKTTSRISPPESYIYLFSLDGNIIQKTEIN